MLDFYYNIKLSERQQSDLYDDGYLQHGVKVHKPPV